MSMAVVDSQLSTVYSIDELPEFTTLRTHKLFDQSTLKPSLARCVSAESTNDSISDDANYSDSDSGFDGSTSGNHSLTALVVEYPGWDLRRRSTSMVEAKDQTYRKLTEELTRAQEELQLKDKECGRLEQVRNQMEQELEELTACLFEEANKMVQDANIKRMHTEKLLSESLSNVEMLQAEVIALKALVLTSTPSEPNRHLHPQLDRKTSKEAPDNSISRKLSFKKTHKRSTSHHVVKAENDFVFDPSKPAPEPPVSNNLDDLDRFERFKAWRDNPTLSEDSQFISDIMKEDVLSCLNFVNKQMSDRVLELIKSNSISIEPLPEGRATRKSCALTVKTCLCTHRIRLSDADEWQDISELVRNRISAVIELFRYLGYVHQGLIKNCTDRDMYWHIADLRKAVSLARLGFKSP